MKKISVLTFLLFVIVNAQIGRIELIDYIPEDMLFSGPIHTYCVIPPPPPTNGLHAYWPSTNGVRYNFYNLTTHTWSWQGGINPFTTRSGFGMLDYDPITGIIILSSYRTSVGVYAPILARDQAIGAGIFQYCTGSLGFLAPLIAVTNNQAIHCILSDVAGFDTIWYTRVQPWLTWSTRLDLFIVDLPSQNLNSSKTSNRVIATWTKSTSSLDSGYFRNSLDNGVTWNEATPINFPPAYSSDTATSFHTAGFTALYDNNDNLHIVTQVHPIVGGNGYAWPAEIWHYCPANTPAWTRIARHDADTVAVSVGYNAIAACRPTIVRNQANNYLYVCWEAFDSLNYEPTTTLLRADIWVAESRNNGLTWQTRRITSPNTTTKRFPGASGFAGDTFVVAYLIDSIAGFATYGQGRATNNPLVVHFIPISAIGFEEISTNNQYYSFNQTTISPNPFNTQTTIRYSLPAESNVSLEIYDVTGRLIKTLADESKSSGVYTTTWDGTDDKGKEVKPGVYFYTFKTSEKIMSGKIIKAH